MKHSVLVIGMGRFGSAAARELMALGHEVLAVDRDEAPINDISPDVTHAIQADASDEDALKDIGAADFDHAIVAMSSASEASIFATMALRNLGVKNIIVKAASTLHGRILERVGASRVVYPEREMGARVAHSFSIPNVIDYLDVAPLFGIVKVRPPASFAGRTLRELDIPGQLSLTPIAVRRGNNVTVNPHRDERIGETDELILIGLDERLERLEG
ncbi:MAG TPA: TrkA family potassium uptake protein [Candidatus Deferrimicrobiaceae bacterium]|nr:TrkA family potassium uptake protein [Candidatus Deferrimicrobiaceae bacterium]